ncbi:MAG: hypothetical protein M1281_05950 [Chloroflexi bacterium]|nr:hypothetical protein [Chloroflexota bacterium]
MVKKAVLTGTVLAVMMILAACGGAQPAQANPGANPVSQTTPAPGNGPVESKLAAGTLKLEGTNLAVTPQQAKTLLPLWEKVKSLEASSNPSSADLQTTYQQIEAAMTAEQIQAIAGMSLTAADIQSLMTSLGMQSKVTPGSGQFAGGFPTQSPEQRAARATQRAQNPNGSGFPAAGTPGSRRSFQGTPGGNQFGGRGFGSTNTLFVDPLIQLLQRRAGSG